MFPDQDTHASAENEEPSIDLRRYLALAWHWAWLLVLASLLAAGGSYYYTSRLTPIYQATATLLVNEAPSTRAADYTAMITNERLAKTYAQMMTKRPVLEAVIVRLGIDRSPGSLSGAITVKPVTDTQLLTISVRDPDPVLATYVANTVGEVFGEQVADTQSTRYLASKENLQTQMADVETKLEGARGELSTLEEEQRQLAASQSLKSGTPVAPATTVDMERLEARIRQYESIYSSLLVSYENVRMAEAQSLSGVVMVEEAQVPTRPISPDVMQNTLLAGMVGLMLAAGVIFAIELLDDTLKNPEEVARRFNLPVMGLIAQHQQEGGQLITLTTPRSPTAEAFRGLRTNIQYAGVDRPIRVLLVTSPAPSDGKTTITSNLAVVMAQGGLRVAVVDADLHRPRVHRVFNLNNERGLSALFVEPKIQMNGWMQTSPQERLQIVSSGPLPPNPSELLGSQKMREILEVLLSECDLVLLDTPPVLSVTDAAVLAPLVDGVLLVVRPGDTRMGALKQAIDSLRRVNANVVGLVLNGVGKSRGYYDYYYKSRYYNYYDKYYSPNGNAKRRKGFTLPFFKRSASKARSEQPEREESKP